MTMNQKTLLGLALLLFLAFTACKNESSEAASTTAPATAVAPGAVQSSGVEHYICPNGHIGYGSDTAGNCTQCSAALTHNQAFHANDPAPAANPAIQMNQNPAIQMQDPSGAVAAPTTPEPAQNAAGVWHYTCASGCAGGAGSATACATCGNPLQHNQSYHN